MDLFFNSIWGLFQTRMNLPWIGNTTPLLMMVFIGLLYLVVGLLNRLWGNDGDD